MKERTPKSGGQAIQSVETSLAVACAVAQSDEPSSVTGLASELGMLPSTVYRHLQALVRAGLLVQVSQNGRYDLGVMARTLGLAALRRMDPQHLWMDAVERLRDEVNQTVLAVVWESQGPVAVFFREPRGQLITIKPGLGAAMSVLRSASGLVFCAHLPKEQTDALIEAEFARKPGPKHNGSRLTRRGLELLLDGVRKEGFASITGATVEGVAALSAPVFGEDGKIELVISVLGSERSMDLSASGALARLLTDECRRLSRQLGAG